MGMYTLWFKLVPGGEGKIVVLDFDDAALLRQRSNRHVGLGWFGRRHPRARDPVTWRSEMSDCSGRAQNNLERRGRSRFLPVDIQHNVIITATPVQGSTVG